MDVTFESGGKAFRASVPVGTHWGKFGKSEETYGFQLWRNDDFRKGYILRTQVRLTAAVGEMVVLSDDLSATEGTILEVGGFKSRSIVTRRLPPPVFPSELLHKFEYSNSPRSLHGQIAGSKLDVFVSLDRELPWWPTRKDKRWGIFFNHEASTSIPSFWLSLKFQAVFHPTEAKRIPLEFEWGTPRVVSSAFETKRSKH